MDQIATSDAALVVKLRQGSDDAAAELFRRHWQATWRAAFAVCGTRAIADDIAQDAFERALTDVHTLNGSGAFGPWVRRIAVNRAIDHLRRERRLGPLTDEIEDPVEWMDIGPGDRRVLAAVAALPMDRRLAVVLRYWFDYTPDEIATALGVPAGTVSSRLSRALTDLRTSLGDLR